MGWETAQQRLVAHLRRHGVRDEAVLAAIGHVPRELFVPVNYRHLAYADEALPLAEGQSISQPIVVAMMTQALEVSPGLRVLEIGTGSGYQAAILAEMGAHIVTIERLPTLAAQARDLLQHLGYHQVEVHQGDGTHGWPDGAPYDRVIITAGAPRVPPPLLAQLAPDGRLVVPVGSLREQQLTVLAKDPTGTVSETQLGPVRFVPLVGEAGWAEEPTARDGEVPPVSEDGVWHPRQQSK